MYLCIYIHIHSNDLLAGSAELRTCQVCLDQHEQKTFKSKGSGVEHGSSRWMPLYIITFSWKAATGSRRDPHLAEKVWANPLQGTVPMAHDIQG